MRASFALVTLCLVFGALAGGCDEFGCGTGSTVTTFNIAGNYQGTQLTVGACANHTPLGGKADAGWKVTDKGADVTIDTGDACSPLTGNLTGNSVDLAASPCTPLTLPDGGTETDAVTGGTVQFTESTLSYTVKLTATVSLATADGGMQTCSGMNAGTLSKTK